MRHNKNLLKLQGLTLVEVLVTAVIVIILVPLGLVGARSMLKGSNSEYLAERFKMSLQEARLQAMETGHSMIVCPVGSNCDEDDNSCSCLSTTTWNDWQIRDANINRLVKFMSNDTAFTATRIEPIIFGTDGRSVLAYQFRIPAAAEACPAVKSYYQVDVTLAGETLITKLNCP